MKQILIILCALCAAACPYSILGIFPHNGKSHFDVFEPLMKELARRGHNVTVISHFPQKTPPGNYEDVSLKNTEPILVNAFAITHLGQSRFDRYIDFWKLLMFGQHNCERGFKSAALGRFVRAGRHFDLIIGEFFNNECFLGLVHKFKAPLVGFTTSAYFAWNDGLLANPSNPSYIPNNFLPLSDRLTFLEKVENTVLYIAQHFVYDYFVSVKNDKVARKLLGEDIPPLRELSSNITLHIVNSHFSLNRPRAHPPGFVEVGGLHIGKSKKVPQVIILNFFID